MPSATPTRPWAGWYSKPQWYKRAQNQLRVSPLCEMCLREGTVNAATVADHIVPHKGDPKLFWFGKLQSLCNNHHNSAKQEIEAKGYTSDIGSDGWPIHPDHPANKVK